MVYRFMESQSNELKTLVEWVVGKSEDAGYDLDYIMQLPAEKIFDVIIEMHPTNIKTITNYLYVFGLYAKYKDDENAVKKFLSIDRNEVWNKYKATGNLKARFISDEEFKDLIFNIETFEPLNSLYYSALLRCIYEGIYNYDMSYIKNLRIADINRETSNITIRDDEGKTESVQVTSDLVEDLIELGNNNHWERKNRYGVMFIEIEGIHPDSCFKIENRGVGDNYRYSYFSRLRKISKEYLERPLKPMNLYVSGIMNRIKKQFDKKELDFEYAFVNHPRLSYGIISNELKRSRYNKEVKYFRQMVIGHLDEFK